ncbi:MAG: hypothetical protein ACKOGB_12365, partial [Betaproteobacteria bacterium]
MSRLARVELGLEARAHREDHLDTRMWLRLLACSTDIEQAIRQRLRQQFGTTLSRFDYLAQLVIQGLFLGVLHGLEQLPQPALVCSGHLFETPTA